MAQGSPHARGAAPGRTRRNKETACRSWLRPFVDRRQRLVLRTSATDLKAARSALKAWRSTPLQRRLPGAAVPRALLRRITTSLPLWRAFSNPRRCKALIACAPEIRGNLGMKRFGNREHRDQRVTLGRLGGRCLDRFALEHHPRCGARLRFERSEAACFGWRQNGDPLHGGSLEETHPIPYHGEAVLPIGCSPANADVRWAGSACRGLRWISESARFQVASTPEGPAVARAVGRGPRVLRNFSETPQVDQVLQVFQRLRSNHLVPHGSMASRLPKLLPCLVGAGCGLAVALGSASPAEAVVYTFNNAKYNINSTEYTVSGSFDWNGTSNTTTNITSFNTIQTNRWFNSANFATSATYNVSSKTLSFFNDTYAGTQNIVITNLTLDNSSGQNFSLSGLGNNNNSLSVRWCIKSQGNCGPLGTSANNKFTGGTLTSVPFQSSALILAPFSGLLLLRKRFRKLVIKPLQPVSA